MSFKKILAAVDDEPVAAHAADIAVDLDRALQAEMALVHVIDAAVGYSGDTGSRQANWSP
jgi:nucleotide-binding universal stress UspA family protein